ncbi:MAG: fructose-6-phosphate aldolase [Sphingobacteriales bacterium JAD_PAG50586_3]|nr:MAG: fructose-6-phosphate aldolase [Sphingobacteriales bacterium JAD_PAG50586_3]
MYILKIKGTAKIPDYIQLRGDDFTLKAYFRLDRPDKSLERIGMGDKLEKIMEFAATLPFGKIEKIEL